MILTIGQISLGMVPWLLRAFVQSSFQRVIFVAKEMPVFTQQFMASLRFFLPDYPLIMLPHHTPSTLYKRHAAAVLNLHRKYVLFTKNEFFQDTIERCAAFCISLRKGQEYSITQLIQYLLCTGYEITDSVLQPGEMARRGGILDVFPVDAAWPVRLEFLGDTVDYMRQFDPITQKSFNSLEHCFIYAYGKQMQSVGRVVKDLQGPNTQVWHTFLGLVKKACHHGQFGTYSKYADLCVSDSIIWNNLAYLTSSKSFEPGSINLKELKELKEFQKFDQMTLEGVSEGYIRNFAYAKVPVSKVPHNVLLHDYKSSIITCTSNSKAAMSCVLQEEEFKEGDYVVHKFHGVCVYEGICTLEDQGEFILLRYADNDKVYVPIFNIELINKHEEAPLDTLGSKAWSKKVGRICDKLHQMAQDILGVTAVRRLREMKPMLVTDQQEFDQFSPHVLTSDQKKCLEEVQQDLAGDRISERLLCADVGFGKTEVAIMAGLIVIQNGLKVVILAPTTLLCNQHYQTFEQRFKGRAKVLKCSKDMHGEEMRDADIIIGTTIILHKMHHISNVGLVVVDEEQHFGVKQKESIKKLEAHVLYMSATPIPRTMQMALNGLQNMSFISKPPMDKKVFTSVLEFNWDALLSALRREKNRGGCSFYVIPRIKKLNQMIAHLEQSGFTFLVVHSQVASPNEVMDEFGTKAYDVLLATHIIEAGLDLGFVNTLVVQDAHLFGLAQLHQLRGRVGRSGIPAYCLFFCPGEEVMPGKAKERLRVLKALDHLGAGMSIAQYDMQMRGTGNLLGAQQAGHIKEIGFHLYQSMLKEAVSQAKARLEGKKARPFFSPDVRLMCAHAGIDHGYIISSSVRLDFYRRMSDVNVDMAALKAEMIDRFGPLPSSAANLIELGFIRAACKRLEIACIRIYLHSMRCEFISHLDQTILDAVCDIAQRDKRVVLQPPNYLQAKWENKGGAQFAMKSTMEILCKLEAQVEATMEEGAVYAPQGV